MKLFIIAVILSTTSLTFAVEPAPMPPAPNADLPSPGRKDDNKEILGTIQEPSKENKKIIKKIMSRKSKAKAESTAKPKTDEKPAESTK